MAKVGAKQIRSALKEILRKYKIKPRRVVLFGSYVKGGDFKDIDIGIVSEDFQNKSFWKKAEIIGNIHWDLVNILGVSLDIIGMTPQEWNKGSTPIFQIFKKYGLGLYPF